MLIQRKKTRTATIGPWTIGGEEAIRVQSMCTTRTEDLAATLAEIHRLEEAGCEIIRVAVPNKESAKNLPALKKAMKVPLVADIHFDWRLAIASIDAGVDKVRLNPGNVGERKRVEEVISHAKRVNPKLAIRIGVNSGSVEQDLLEKYGFPSPDALVESALRHVAMVEEMGFHNLIVSLKSSDTAAAVEAYRKFAAVSQVPLHLGITEAGKPPYGVIKSAAGLGALLLDGIGDTIRISLTGDVVEEVKTAYDLLKATGRRVISPEIISCPTCGRIEIDLEKVVKEIEDRLHGETLPVKISVLGCVVNGPGEALESDIGVAGGKGVAVVYRKGERIATVKEEELVDALFAEIQRYKAEQAKGVIPAAPKKNPSKQNQELFSV